MWGVALMVLLALGGQVSGMTLFDRSANQNEEVVVPKMVRSFNTDWRRHKRSVAMVPDHVIVKLSLQTGDLDLWVTRSEDNTLNMMEYTAGGGQVTEVMDTDDVHSSSGSFQHGSKTYYIQPDHVNSSTNIAVVQHVIVVWEPADSPNLSDDEQCKSPPVNRYKREAEELAMENTLEVFFVVDDDNFQRYKTVYGKDDSETKQLIKLNIAYAAESANLHLQSIRDQFPDTVIRLCAVGVLIISDPSHCDYIDKNLIGGRVLNEKKAVQDFVKFVANNSWHLPRADHFIAFTSYPFNQSEDLFETKYNLAFLCTDTSVIGTNVTTGRTDISEARRGNMCAADSVSLARDALAGTNGQSVAHALGHSLNALNDDEYEDDSCQAGYTMFPTQNVETTSGNVYLFSPCSAASIRSFLPGLQCTKTENVFMSKLEVGDVRNNEFYNPEQLCKNALGPASNFCRFVYAQFPELGCFDAVCRFGLFCQIPFQGICRVILGYERLSCGNGKWCQGSACVSNPRALRTLGDDLPAFDSINFPCDSRFCSVYGRDFPLCPLTCKGLFTCPEPVSERD